LGYLRLALMGGLWGMARSSRGSQHPARKGSCALRTALIVASDDQRVWRSHRCCAYIAPSRLADLTPRPWIAAVRPAPSSCSHGAGRCGRRWTSPRLRRPSFLPLSSQRPCRSYQNRRPHRTSADAALAIERYGGRAGDRWRRGEDRAGSRRQGDRGGDRGIEDDAVIGP